MGVMSSDGEEFHLEDDNKIPIISPSVQANALRSIPNNKKNSSPKQQPSDKREPGKCDDDSDYGDKLVLLSTLRPH